MAGSYSRSATGYPNKPNIWKRANIREDNTDPLRRIWSHQLGTVI